MLCRYIKEVLIHNTPCHITVGRSYRKRVLEDPFVQRKPGSEKLSTRLGFWGRMDPLYPGQTDKHWGLYGHSGHGIRYHNRDTGTLHDGYMDGVYRRCRYRPPICLVQTLTYADYCVTHYPFTLTGDAACSPTFELYKIKSNSYMPSDDSTSLSDP